MRAYLALALICVFACPAFAEVRLSPRGLNGNGISADSAGNLTATSVGTTGTNPKVNNLVCTSDPAANGDLCIDPTNFIKYYVNGALYHGASGQVAFSGVTAPRTWTGPDADATLLTVGNANNVAVKDKMTTKSGTAPTLSSCGTGPTLDTGSSNYAGTIHAGSGSPTACTLTFAGGGFTNTPSCVISGVRLQVFSARSNTAFTTSSGAMATGEAIAYHCVGLNE